MIDNKGMISTEIIVLLIILILTVGIVLNFTEKANEKLTYEIKEDNIGKIANEFVDSLINTPGNPQNWEKLNNKNNVLVGLGIIDENNKTIANSVSYEKLMALSSEYKKQIDEKTFNKQYKTSLIIKPLTGSIEPITLGQSIDNPSYTVNRLVTCDFYKKYTINDFETNGKCNSYHLTPHTCNHFKVYKSWLKKTDYYLLFEKNSYKDYKWTFSSTLIGGIPKTVGDDVIYLNPEIEKKSITDNNGVMFIHIDKKDAKAVLVGVPKDFDKNKLSYDYFIQTECNLMFKLEKSS